jgi:hypothetical protein
MKLIFEDFNEIVAVINLVIEERKRQEKKIVGTDKK